MNLDESQGNTLLTHREIMHKYLLLEPNMDRTSAIERVTQNIPTIITQEQKEAFMTPIMQAEVDHAIQELPIGMAPGVIHYFRNPYDC
jgi:hypothetical protein